MNTSATASVRRPSPFVASPFYDGLFLVFSPALALLAAWALPRVQYFFDETTSFGERDTRIGHFIAIWTASHLAAVVFRSHLNREIFALHRFRFVVVPLLLILAIASSQRIWVAAFVVATLWDIYHSSMQNFGIGRIYDAKRGNDPLAGRKLDMMLAHVLYIAPIAAGGLTLTKSLSAFDLFSGPPWQWDGPARFLGWCGESLVPIRWTVIGISVGFLLYYVYAYWKLCRAGYKISPWKIWLFASVAVASSSWFLMDFIAALFVINFYHALQYFAIVWWMERKNMQKVMHVERNPAGRWVALGVFVLALTLIGMGMEAGENFYQGSEDENLGLSLAAAAGLTCALMHFWYDGFVWSVRKKQV